MYIVKNRTNGNFLGPNGFNVRSTKARVFRRISDLVNSVGMNVALDESERQLPKYRRRNQRFKKVLPSNMSVYEVNIVLKKVNAAPVRGNQ